MSRVNTHFENEFGRSINQPKRGARYQAVEVDLDTIGGSVRVVLREVSDLNKCDGVWRPAAHCEGDVHRKPFDYSSPGVSCKP